MPDTDRARAHIDRFVARLAADHEATWARLVKKGWATYVERDGVLDIVLTDAGEARAAELRSIARQGNN